MQPTEHHALVLHPLAHEVSGVGESPLLFGARLGHRSRGDDIDLICVVVYRSARLLPTLDEVLTLDPSK